MSEECHPLVASNKKLQCSENGVEITKKGLGLFSATVFVAGEMAGSGVLALPKAVVNCGFIGLILLLVFCGNAAYGGIKLGHCWQIIEERYPEHRKSTRNPYAVIADKAVGNFGSYLVSHCIRITLFGAGTVYILLAAQIFQELFANVLPVMSSCSYFLIIATLLVPPMWLASPKEFHYVGVGALFTTIIACILFFIQIIFDGTLESNKPIHRVHGFKDFFLSFGTLLFAFGGASTFPTIQNDMRNKKQFSTCVLVASGVILFLYLPLSAAGYYVYGEAVQYNITLSLTKSAYVYVANILMAVHLIFAFLIVTNPVSQELEESFNVPKVFGWKRCFLRTMMMIAMMLIGETFPQFGVILSLIGGSTITLLTFVFPPFFYMRLCDMESPKWSKRIIPLHEKIYMWQLVVIGLFGGCASTYSSINTIFGSDSFTKPCYWVQ
ncbi:unnamed protein product [Brassicogethes aeneus]|uniref:Amino acid transporter transmembrane domain-containing protein n=1 Tax=Brassicogethes aeneus TaxID=1431903 RepID=A0A9P0AQM3_BRAAE|nr:unnamed protein product [Brassicogethes aeneus]